jgi:hypothetical protein
MTDKATDAELEARIRRIMEKVEPLIRETLSRAIRPLHEIEIDVDKVGDIVKETITKEAIEQAGDGYSTTRAACQCGAAARFCGRRRRQIITLHGHLSFRRAYYYCRGCNRGFCPTDAKLDLGSGDCSRVVKAFASRVASYLPFAVATDELRALRHIDISTTTLQRLAKDVGERIGAAWDDLGEQFARGQAPASGMHPERLFLGMDAAKGHIGGEWRDIKLAATYHRAANGLISFAEYYGSLDRSVDFGRRLPAMAHIAGGDNCDDWQMVGDGAKWIWTETTKHLPAALQTLDFYHGTEHLQTFAKARFGEGAPAGYAWVDRQKGRLLNGDLDQIRQEVADWQPCGALKTAVQRSTANYLTENSSRMNYKALREAGYDIGSGLIESGCKMVVKNRMGGAGMRWEGAGATAVLNLSAFWRSDRSSNYLQYT